MKTHAEYMERINKHIAADAFIRGSGWLEDEQKGCAVGCTFGYYNHARSAKETNTPKWLWHIEDVLYEGMSLNKSKTWPREFFQRINFHTPEDVWRDKVLAPFMVVVLESTLDTFDHKESPDVLACVERAIALWKRDDLGSNQWAAEAAEAAEAAVWAAEAAKAAEAAVWAAKAAARAAAKAAVWAARAAAKAAVWAAKAAAEVAIWAAAAEAAAAESAPSFVAETEKFNEFSDAFLTILDKAFEEELRGK